VLATKRTDRRFPPPWFVEQQSACFVVRDHNGQQLAYAYFEDEPGRRSAAKLLTRDQAAGATTKGLIAALQLFGRIAVSVHNALNRVIASRTGKNL
jgi:hypothetical protein